MAKFIPGAYLDDKIEIEFDQGDERERLGQIKRG
jgi:hypothetical protein